MGPATAAAMLRPALLVPAGALVLSVLLGAGCNPKASGPSSTGVPAPGSAAVAEACVRVDGGFGPSGASEIRVETVASGLRVPWGVAFLPGGDALVTERPGRLRLVRGATGDAARLVPEPVATVEIGSTSEGGLLGIALHPDFEATRLFFLYVTTATDEGATNRVERWRLAPDATTATLDRVVYDRLPAARFHNGGRLRIGPDAMLYVGTGDARRPSFSQDPANPAGALLRLTLDGAVPDDNPTPGSAVVLSGIRNTQGWDWPDPADAGLFWMTDHGPSGELLRRGHDEVSIARAGDNLGWPTIYGCEEEDGMRTPALTWSRAAPPGGAAIYTGTAIPEWRGSLIIGTLGSRHLHRVEIRDGRVAAHEGYLEGDGGEGRLRDVLMGPDGELYVTTSNCDGRGSCPPEGDRLLRITR